MFSFRWTLLAATLITLAPEASAFDGNGPRRWRPSLPTEPWAPLVVVPLEMQAMGTRSGQTVYIDPVTNAIRPGPTWRDGRSDLVQLPPPVREYRWGRTPDGYLFIDASAQQETLTATLGVDGTPHFACSDASHGHAPASARAGEER